MDKNEIALQLTLKAIDEKALFLIDYANEDETEMASQNLANAKMISNIFLASFNK